MTPEELHNIFRTEEQFWWYRGMRAITQALLDPVLQGQHGRALDAGCGTGFNALVLQSRYGLRTVGVDLAPLALRYCGERNFRPVLLASIEQLPFPENCFDLICSFDVLSHLPEAGDRRAIAEFARVLSPGGWLLFRVPAFHALRSRHSEYIAEKRRYRAGQLAPMLQEANLRIVRSTYAMTLLSPVSWFKSRVLEPLRRQPPASRLASVPSRRMNDLLAGVLGIEAALIRRGIRLPFGQSCIALARKSGGSDAERAAQ